MAMFATLCLEAVWGGIEAGVEDCTKFKKAVPHKGTAFLVVQGVRQAAPKVEEEKEEIFRAEMVPMEAAAEDLYLNQDREREAEALASFVEGLLYEERAETQKMLESFQKTLDYDPGFVELAQRVALEMVRRGNMTEALGVLKDAIKASPEEPSLYLQVALIYSRSIKKIDQAVEYARKAKKLAPQNLMVYQSLYEIYVEADQSKNAVKVLQEAGKVDWKEAEQWLKLGEWMVSLMGSSEKEDQKLLENAEAYFERALELAGEDILILTAIADHYVMLGKLEHAIPLYIRILETKELEELTQEREFRMLVQEKLAKSFLVTGKRDEGIQVLEEMVKESPLQYELYELLGKLYEEDGAWEKAVAAYQHSLKLRPDHWGNYIRQADLYLQMNRAEEAVEVMEEAYQKFSDFTDVGYVLAIAYSRAKEHEKAIKMFEKVSSVLENSGDGSGNAIFYYYYGAASEQAGEYEKAAELFKKSIAQDPANSASAYNYLAYMWAEQGVNLEEAEQYVNQALAMEPENGAYVDTLGWIYYKQNRLEPALAELLRATELIQPADPLVLEHVGDVYLKLGNKAQAEDYYRKALELDSENQELQQKLEQLSSSPSPQKSVPASQ